MLHNKMPYGNGLYRKPSDIMNLKRMGAMHQSRLSFARTLVRRMAQEKWYVYLEKWDISDDGFGTAIYGVNTPHNVYQLVVFTQYIKDEERDDRVIAEKWDSTLALVRGVANETFLRSLKDNVPHQEAGRVSGDVLVLSRANKSVRVFNHVVDRLSEGRQPDLALLQQVGYLLRTTAVYGNGKFGMADFESLRDNADFSVSFSAQMLAVYLLRQFSIDWVHDLARRKGGEKAATLHRSVQQFIGTGNATGLGMAPFLISHPKVVDTWLYQRERALSEVLSQAITEESKGRFVLLLGQARKHITEVVVSDARQKELNARAQQELGEIITSVGCAYQQKLLWSYLINLIRDYSYEAQEITVSCLIDLCPQLVDKYAARMNADESSTLLSGLSKERLLSMLETKFAWAIGIDFDRPENAYWFWYASEDKGEPRLGVRYEDEGWETELPLDTARKIATLYRDLKAAPAECTLAHFLLQYPGHRGIARRVWTMGNCELGEIQVNSIGKDLLPMDFLRAKLAMLGATKFDPRSDRWVQVTFFQGAPLLDHLNATDWYFPTLPVLYSDSCRDQQRVAIRDDADEKRVTYNEIFLQCQRAFNSLQRVWGESDLIATAVADVEVVERGGVAEFVSLLRLLRQVGEQPPVLTKRADNVIQADLGGSSVVVYLPILLDQAIESFDSEMTLEIVNGHQHWLALGRIMRLHFENFCIQAFWKEEQGQQCVEYLYSPEDGDEHLYIAVLIDEQEKRLRSAGVLHDGVLTVRLHKKPIASVLSATAPEGLSGEQLTEKRQRALQRGFYVARSNWDVIKEAAEVLLVPDSERSQRQAGAIA